MIDFLYRMFIGHNHKWSVHERLAVMDDGPIPNSIIFVMKCEHCGELKRFKVGA
jgi:hypothetical protein